MTQPHAAGSADSSAGHIFKRLKLDALDLF